MEDIIDLAERIIEHTADALIYANCHGNIVRWNSASVALFGFGRHEAVGSSLDIIIPEHLRAAHWAGFNAALRNGHTKLQGRPTLTRALHKDGRRLYVEMTFALVKDAAGSVVGSVAVARDVTEKVEKERTKAKQAVTATATAEPEANRKAVP